MFRIASQAVTWVHEESEICYVYIIFCLQVIDVCIVSRSIVKRRKWPSKIDSFKTLVSEAQELDTVRKVALTLRADY